MVLALKLEFVEYNEVELYPGISCHSEESDTNFLGLLEQTNWFTVTTQLDDTEKGNSETITKAEEQSKHQ